MRIPHRSGGASLVRGMGKAATLTIYRALLRVARRWEAELGGFVDLRMPLVPDGWQRHLNGWSKSGAEYRKETARKLLPGLEHPVSDSVYGLGRKLRAYIHDCFKRSANAPTEKAGPLLDTAFAALRLLGDQLEMAQCSSTAVTRGIQVDVNSAFNGTIPLPAAPSGDQAYLYSYRIRVSNFGDEKVQLTGRHWVSKDASGRKHMTIPRHSPGVVGCTPILKPGDCFEYYSGVDLPTPRGTMQGCFHLVTLPPQGTSPERFDAIVAPFPLRAPPEYMPEPAPPPPLPGRKKDRGKG